MSEFSDSSRGRVRSNDCSRRAEFDNDCSRGQVFDSTSPARSQRNTLATALLHDPNWTIAFGLLVLHYAKQ